jgi:formiminoglutamase
MSVFHTPAQKMTGRDDIEDGPLAKRVYHFAQPEEAGHETEIALMGFACDAGVNRNKGRIGAKAAPAAIRKALANLAAPESFSVFTDWGDITVEGNDLEEGQALYAEHLSAALKIHKRVVVLGGGHETAYGSFCGLRAAYPKASIGIINLDAHLDLRNIGADGPSSGTPFNQIRTMEKGNFDYLCIGAAREANTQALFARAKEWGVNVVFDTELAKDPNCAAQKITHLFKRNDIIYLTIDIDLLPHFHAPGVSAPAARGVPLSTVELILHQIKSAAKDTQTPIPIADIVEVSPPHDRNGMTAKTAAVLALGLMIG